MLNTINSFVWPVAIIMLIGGGLYLTVYLEFYQFKFRSMFHSFKHKKNSKITPFKSLTMALAARIGVGSLAGVALAIYLGGPSTVFWIWISSVITSINAFSESVLGIKYREVDEDVYKGGPSYYIDKGLNKKFLAKLYAILIIIAYIFGFITIQANTISKSLFDYIGLSKVLTGIILMILTGVVIVRGVKAISNLTSKLVPFMGIIYIFLSLYVIVVNYKVIPVVIFNIIRNAFNFKSFGIGILTSFIIGIQRGVFSTEAGLGSGAIAASTTDSDNKVGMGLIQVLGIYFVSFIICTSTALIILTSDYMNTSFIDINGIEITQYALKYHLGNIGILILVISIISFAFSTVISGYYYGESNLKYLIKNIKSIHIYVLKIVTLLLIIVGSVIGSQILWTIVDIFVGIMAIINMYAVFLLKKDVKDEIKSYKFGKHLL